MAHSLPFSEFQSRFLKLYVPTLAAPATHKKYRQVLRDFARLTGAQTVADLTTDAVLDFIGRRSESIRRTTLRSHLRCLKTASFFAREEGLLDRVPQWRRLMPRRSTAPKLIRHFRVEEVGRLLDHLEAKAVDWHGRRLYAIAAVVAYTGLRKREALCLHLADVDLAAGVLFVLPCRYNPLKTEAAAAPVPIAPELSPILAPWVATADSEWLFPGWRRKGPWIGGCPGNRPIDALRQAGEAVGMAGLTFHGLRHTLAKLYVSHFNGTRDQAQSLLRHTDPQTTEEHYLHRDDIEQLRRLGARISFRPPEAA